MDPERIRPGRDFVLILAEPRKEVLASGILLPIETGAEKVTEGSGHIIRVGNGKRADVVGLSPGDRVVYRSFLKEANPVPTDQKWADGRKKEYFIIDVNDIMSIVPSDVEVGVFSRPATSGAVVDSQGDLR